MTVDELTLTEIEKDNVGWLDRVNFDMEIILKKENSNKNLLSKLTAVNYVINKQYITVRSRVNRWTSI